ncbi:hypothetical protein QZH41_020389, partial [Actinostola sp. cb2023]
MVQRTVARRVTILELIGGGRFGQVYRGQFQGGDVAVKIFKSREELSWSRETEIYQTTMLRHENILGFIASDCQDSGLETELWIITDYQKNGSLFDYLPTVRLDISRLLRMVLSIANGLSHLHTEIVGIQGKPAMSHRDIKSRNILVKNDGTCCIADLGLAVRYVHSSRFLDIADSSRNGTARYLSPELLIDDSTVLSFTAYQKSDMYAFGLVLWEMARRCETGEGEIDSYELPFFDRLQCNPSVEDVR